MDNLNKMQRLKNMSSIKSKNTKPEMVVRSILFKKDTDLKFMIKVYPEDLILYFQNTI